MKGHNVVNNANGVVYVWQRGEFLTIKDVIHCGLVPRSSEVISVKCLGTRLGTLFPDQQDASTLIGPSVVQK